MIKGILELVIIVIVSTTLNFNKKVNVIEEKMDLFYKAIKDSGISYRIDQELYLTFDFNYIKEIAYSVFKDYEIEIEMVDMSHFTIKVIVEEKFLNREIKEEIYLRKGDLYD